MADKTKSELLAENETLRQQLETQNGLIDELQRELHQKPETAQVTGGKPTFTLDAKTYVVRMPSIYWKGKKMTAAEVAADETVYRGLVKMKSPAVKEVK